jgi:hypothetical protein
MNDKSCSNCGTKLPSEASFCTVCGSGIEAVQGVPTAMPVNAYPPPEEKKASLVYIVFIILPVIGVVTGAVIFFLSGGWLYETTLWIIGISIGVGGLFSGLLTPRRELWQRIAIVFGTNFVIILLLFLATLILSFTLDDYILLIKVTLVPFAACYLPGLFIRILSEYAFKSSSKTE